MSSKFDVGDVRANPNRPQVFHAGYCPTPDHRRVKDGYTYEKPWHCTLDGMAVNDGFPTYAEAIQCADRLARGQLEVP